MEWSLLHPALWPLLGAAAVPLLVHLISRRRAREVRFGPMEFVLRSQRRSARRIQLRQWLLMAARTLAILLVVLAILGPYRHPPQAAGGPAPAAVHHVFALDVSASMHAAPEGTPRWETAVQRARQAARALRPEEPLGVVECGAAPHALLDPPSFDRAASDDALGRVRPSVAAGDLPACLVRARAALGPEGGRITVFTDAARHSWPAGARLELGGAQVRVVRPDDQAPPNRAVRALTARAAPEAGPRAVAIEWEAEVFGATAPVATGAALWVDGAAVARADVELVPGSPTRRRFTHVLPKGADPFHELAVRLDADAYALDDVLMLPVQAPREVQVLVVDGDPQTVAWRDEVFYLERALAASPPGGGTLQQRVLTTAPTVADIDAADVILLCNVRNLPREAVGALERHVERGGGLLISGGDRVDVDFYNGALGGLLPQPLRGEKSRVELEDPAHREVLGIGAVDTSHPVFAPFNGERPEGLARAQTHTVLLLEPGSRAERQVLMRFSNQAPALVERRVGAGRVLLWATSIDRDWSDLAIRPGFLPLMQQLVLHLADALDDGRPRHQAVHVPRVIPLPRGASSVAVEAPGGPRTAVPIRAEDTQVSLPAATVTGLHRVFIAPADGPATEIPSERYAAWPPPEESDLVALTDDEIAARLPAGSELVGRGGTDGVPRQPLWSLLLLLLPLALLAEATLARRG